MDLFTLSSLYQTENIYLPVYSDDYKNKLSENLNHLNIQLLIISRSISDMNDLKAKQTEIINRICNKLPQHCKPFSILNISSPQFDCSFLKNVGSLKKILMLDVIPSNYTSEIKFNEAFNIENISIVCAASAITVDNNLEMKKKMWVAVTTI